MWGTSCPTTGNSTRSSSPTAFTRYRQQHQHFIREENVYSVCACIIFFCSVFSLRVVKLPPAVPCCVSCFMSLSLTVSSGCCLIRTRDCWAQGTPTRTRYTYKHFPSNVHIRWFQLWFSTRRQVLVIVLIRKQGQSLCVKYSKIQSDGFQTPWNDVAG